MGIPRLAIICAGLLAVGVSVQIATGAPPTINCSRASAWWVDIASGRMWPAGRSVWESAS